MRMPGRVAYGWGPAGAEKGDVWVAAGSVWSQTAPMQVVGGGASGFMSCNLGKVSCGSE
jgi:hypothetical protein